VVIAGVVVAAILRRYSVGEIAARLREGNALGPLPLAALNALTFLVLATAADMVVLRRFGSLSFLDVARGKAASAVLATVGYFFSNGGYGVWIARRTSVGASLGAGLVLYFMIGDLTAIGVVTCVTMPWVSGVPLTVRLFAAAIAIVPMIALALGPLLPGAHFRGLDPWRKVPRSAGFSQLAFRCLNIGLAVLFTSLAARAFGLAVPLGTLLAYVPLLLLVTSMPVNVAGIGAAQAAWLLFFLPFEQGSRIVAFQLVWTAMMGAGIVLRGLPFLPRALGQIAGGVGATAAGRGVARNQIRSRAIQIRSRAIQIRSRAIQIRSRTIQIRSRAIQIRSRTIQIRSRTIQIRSRTIQIRSRTIQIRSRAIQIRSRAEERALRTAPSRLRDPPYFAAREGAIILP
jgi:hypothetical protein